MRGINFQYQAANRVTLLRGCVDRNDDQEKKNDATCILEIHFAFAAEALATVLRLCPPSRNDLLSSRV